MRPILIARIPPFTVLKDDDLGDPARFSDGEGRRGGVFENQAKTNHDVCTYGHTIDKGGKMDVSRSVTSSWGSELVTNRTQG